MKTADKHYKIINSSTGYAIYYHTISADLSPAYINEELEKIKAQVAVQNNIFSGSLYWEEIKDEVS